MVLILVFSLTTTTTTPYLDVFGGGGDGGKRGAVGGDTLLETLAGGAQSRGVRLVLPHTRRQLPPRTLQLGLSLNPGRRHLLLQLVKR